MFGAAKRQRREANAWKQEGLGIEMAKSREKMGQHEVVENKLFVGNMDTRVSEAMVIKLFKEFGRIVDMDFLWHAGGVKAGEAKGQAFLEFAKRSETVAAQDAMNGKVVFGRALQVRFATATFWNEMHGGGMEEAAANLGAAAEGGGTAATFELRLAEMEGKKREVIQKDKVKEARKVLASVHAQEAAIKLKVAEMRKRRLGD